MVTSCWNQYSCSKHTKFVINSLRLSAGTISLKKIVPTIPAEGYYTKLVVSVKIFIKKYGNYQHSILKM